MNNVSTFDPQSSAAPRLKSRLAKSANCGIRKKLTILLLLLPAAIANAVPLSQIDIGDTYFINNIFSENDLVVVKRIDHSRGTVKVQYTSGGVDWVRPSSLITRKGSRNADVTEGLAGAAIVGGALWALLDPDGFKEAMNGSSKKRSYESSRPKATRPKPSRANPKVSSSNSSYAPPRSPDVGGSWSRQNQEWVRWCEGTLKSALGKSVGVREVRTKAIPFYSGVSKGALLVEISPSGYTGAYYLVTESGKPGWHMLNGTGTPIHDFNKKIGFRIRSAQDAIAYVKFFSSAVAGDGGVFRIVDPKSNEKWVTPRLRSKARSATVNYDGTWKVKGSVLYDGDLFDTTFSVSADGNVEMLEDILNTGKIAGVATKIDTSRWVSSNVSG